MKVVPLVSLLVAAAYAVPTPDEIPSEDIEVKSNAVLDTAAADPISGLTKSTVNGEKVLPRLSQTSASAGTTRVKKTYGPWMVSSTKMMSTVIAGGRPCPMSCYVTAMEATILYPDKSEANVDTGAWLHHIALGGTGTGGLGIWAAGNERPTLRLNVGGNKFGIDFPAAFAMMVDLMSEDVKPKNLTLQITFEYAPKTDTSYKGVVMHWLTIGEPAAKSGKFSFNTLPSSVTASGKLLYAIGHMHDGGTDMQLYVGSKMVCKSVMHYNARAGYGSSAKGGSMDDASVKTSSGGSKSKSSFSSSSSTSSSSGHSHKMVKVKRQHAHGAGGGEHISDPGVCTDFGTVKIGDVLKATANYDANKHTLMVANGKKERLMGNMRVYIGPTGLLGSSSDSKSSSSSSSGLSGLLSGLFGGSSS